jgi:glycosyltransferase involved in cell wall biosynthesis
MPVRNEALHIGRSLGSVIAQDYPLDRMEVWVMDGMSDDDTLALAQLRIDELKARGGSGDVVANPGHTPPSALNLALGRARGEVIVRVDGHCELPREYVNRCVRLLDQTGADCVGGAVLPQGRTLVERAIALATTSLVGTGGAQFRQGRRAGWVDTVFPGVYRRAVFDLIGMFREDLYPNEDDEFNLRLRQSGGRVWLESDLRVSYQPRSTLRELWAQYRRYGYTKVGVMKARGRIPSLRSVVPSSFLLAVVASVLTSAAIRSAWPAIVVLGSYVVVNIVSSVWLARTNVTTLLLLPSVLAVLHLSYGIGTLKGLWAWRSWSKADPACGA